MELRKIEAREIPNNTVVVISISISGRVGSRSEEGSKTGLRRSILSHVER